MIEHVIKAMTAEEIRQLAANMLEYCFVHITVVVCNAYWKYDIRYTNAWDDSLNNGYDSYILYTDEFWELLKNNCNKRQQKVIERIEG